MIVLGFDLGLAALGWARVDVRALGGASPATLEVLGFGVFTTKKEAKRRKLHVGSDDARRMDSLASGIVDQLGRGPRAQLIGYEIPGGSQGARAAHAMGLAHGLVRGLLHTSTVPVVEVTARDGKVAFCDSATASKEAMVAEAENWCAIWTLPEGVREHAADAIAVALAAAETSAGRSVFALSGGT